jgi:hypothetical protein
MHPHGLVAKQLVGLPIRADEPALGGPPRLPLTLGELGVLKTVARFSEPTAATHHPHPSLPEPALDPGQAGLKVLQPLLLGPPLLAGGIPTGPATPPTDRHRQPLLNGLDRPTQAGAGVQ